MPLQPLGLSRRPPVANGVVFGVTLQLEMAAGPALRRARKLLRKVGQEPRLLDPDMEEALDGEAGSRGCNMMWLLLLTKLTGQEPRA